MPAEPEVAVTRLIAEIRELGYTGSADLLVRYLDQGRAEAERTPPSPRRLVCWFMTRPETCPPITAATCSPLVRTCPPWRTGPCSAG